MENDKKGLFITFEGIDGCGKTTQLNLLNNYLKSKNYNTVVTLEPGGCEIGEKLREILLHHNGFVSNRAEMFLYLADRSQHVDEIIVKSIREEKIVLCDRYIDSTVAYQGFGRSGDIEAIDYLNSLAIDNCMPDLTFIFDIDPIIASKRLGKEKDRLESESLNFHQKVREGYLELAKKYSRIKVLDASLSIDELFLAVKNEIEKIL